MRGGGLGEKGDGPVDHVPWLAGPGARSARRRYWHGPRGAPDVAWLALSVSPDLIAASVVRAPRAAHRSVCCGQAVEVAAVALWLVTAADRPTSAVSQLLEARPHDTATVEHLIDHWRDASPAPEPDPVPPSAGIDYPDLTYRTSEQVMTRARLCAGLRGSQRTAVAETWQSAVRWTHTWLQENPQLTRGQLADALYRLTWAGDTGSELLVRAQAALATVDRARIVVNRELVATSLTVAWGETRPYQWRQGVHRAAALADRVAAPQVAAVIALGVIYRHPATVRRATVGGTAPGGSIVANDWANRSAVPPPLRRALATQREQLTRAGAGARDPLLPGTTHGRLSTPEIEDILAQNELPESL